jgi:hypothetical protein
LKNEYKSQQNQRDALISSLAS